MSITLTYIPNSKETFYVTKDLKISNSVDEASEFSKQSIENSDKIYIKYGSRYLNSKFGRVFLSERIGVQFYIHEKNLIATPSPEQQLCLSYSDFWGLVLDNSGIYTHSRIITQEL